MSEIHTLKKPLSEISFYSREQIKGKTISNKCGRDFLYYVLNYHQPRIFNAEYNNPRAIDEKHLFGTPTRAGLAWTQIQFRCVPKLLNKFSLRLLINGKYISSYFLFLRATLFSRTSFKMAMATVENAIRHNQTVGVDISLGWAGFLDHVLFVYGFDENNLYVFDTHKVKNLEYKSVENSFYYYALPKSVIKKRWTRFGRVWEVL